MPDFKAGVPIAAIFEAFRAHDVVALTDPLGDAQVQALLLSLRGRGCLDRCRRAH